MFNSFAIDHIVGESAWSQRVRKRILQVAPYRYNVLVSGPSGTGKELVARAVHAHSSRADKPFIPVDCATIPSGLFASQLFGHLKGAFTGASHASMGCFRAADGGTIFLDEIGELDLDLQAKLLRVLQEKQVVPVGGHDPIPVDVRVVAATHRDLQQEVKAGRFRLDLFYRLNVVRMETAPLKDRTEDISVLAEHFLARFAVDNGTPLKRLGRRGLACLQAHDWPGNVRELEHAIERGSVFHEGGVLDESAFSDLHTNAIPGDETVSSIPDVRQTAPVADPVVQDRDVVHDQDDDEIASIPFLLSADGSASDTAIDKREPEHYDWQTLAEVEAAHIQKTLKETFYNQSAAARLLGIDRKQLARKVKKYDIRIPRLSPGRPAEIT